MSTGHPGAFVTGLWKHLLQVFSFEAIFRGRTSSQLQLVPQNSVCVSVGFCVSGDPFIDMKPKFITYFFFFLAQKVKNLPAMQETQVWSLGWEDPLRKGMATHSSILPWRIPRTEEPGGLWSMGLQKVRYHWSDLVHTHASDEDVKISKVYSFLPSS